MGQSGGRPRSTTPKLLERHVSGQLRDFLAWRGWRIYRNNVTIMQDYAGNVTKYGEPGMPDLLAIFYRNGSDQQPGEALVLWLEVKQKGKQLRPNQVIWHRDELARGACVAVADDFEEFEGWYWRTFGWLHTAQGQQHLFQAES